MFAVEGAEPDIVELVIVFADQPFAAGVLLPEPILEAVLDFLLLVAGRFCRRAIDHVAITWAS